MIDILQKQFITTAMTAITILLILLLGVINIFHATSMINNSKQRVAYIAHYESQLDPMDPEFYMTDPVPNAALGDPDNPALFFVALVDQNGIALINSKHLYGLSEENAIAIVYEAIEKDNSEGKIENYRYASEKMEKMSGEVYVFFDITTDREEIYLMIFLSFLLGTVCWFAMRMLVIALSKKAIAPIARNMERQKQFVTDAGHELKTPLAIILANTEALELHQGESKWSRNIRGQVQRLSGLTQNMLTLAKAGEGAEAENKTVFSLSELTAETLKMFEEPLAQRGLTLDSAIESNVDLRANKEQIAQLLSILTDNAVKYAKAKTVIRTELKKTEKGICLRFINECDVLPDCDPQQLFDRFYRENAARTQKSGGYGIGLSAALAIAELHGGTITAKYEENKILFTVKLP